MIPFRFQRCRKRGETVQGGLHPGAPVIGPGAQGRASGTAGGVVSPRWVPSLTSASASSEPTGTSLLRSPVLANKAIH